MATTTEKDKQQNYNQERENVKDKAKETANAAKEKAKETTNYVTDKAQQAGEYARDRADDAVSGTGKGMEQVSDKMREKGPQSGMFGKANEAVADTLEQTGEYLEEKGLSGMAEDVTDMIRRNPIPAVLIGVGVGFMIAKLTSPRSY